MKIKLNFQSEKYEVVNYLIRVFSNIGQHSNIKEYKFYIFHNTTQIQIPNLQHVLYLITSNAISRNPTKETSSIHPHLFLVNHGEPSSEYCFLSKKQIPDPKSKASMILHTSTKIKSEKNRPRIKDK